jgi:hypothetical protein
MVATDKTEVIVCVGESPRGFPARGTAKPKSELRGRVGPSRSVSDGLRPSEVQRTMIYLLSVVGPEQRERWVGAKRHERSSAARQLHCELDARGGEREETMRHLAYSCTD